MKRILFVHHTFRDQSYNSLLWELAQRIDREKYEILACCLREGGAYEQKLKEAGVKVRNLGLRSLLDVSVIPRLARYIKDEHVDIVHTAVFPADFYGRIAARLAMVPVVFSSVLRYEEHKQELAYLCFFFMDRLTSCLTTKLIAISNAVKEYLVRWHKIQPGKVEVIYRGVDVDRFLARVERRKYKLELGLPPEKYIVCSVARLVKVKGLTYLLEAAAKVLRHNDQVQFLIVGDGPLRRRLELRAQRLGVREAVSFTGFRKDIPQVLAIADVFVSASLSEGLGNAILEAMAAGKPVVATRVGGVPETVLHKKAGILVPPRDPDSLKEAILFLLRSPNTRTRMGKEARRRALECFSTDRMVKEYERLYQTHAAVY